MREGKSRTDWKLVGRKTGGIHRSANERGELRVDREILLRQARVVTYRLHFRNFRQQWTLRTPQVLRNARNVRAIERGLRWIAAAGLAMFEDQHVHSFHLVIALSRASRCNKFTCGWLTHGKWTCFFFV